MEKLTNKEKDFLINIIQLEKEYNISLGHEDGQGAFTIKDGFDEVYADWLMNAYKEN